MLFSELDLVVDDPPGGTAWNMALDEALARLSQHPTLRLYRWAEPTISFGCFGKVAEIRALRPGWPLVRRWTGGGLVEHGTDWTYSLMVPKTDPLARLKPAESYAVIHTAIRDFLQNAGWPVALATASASEGTGCFQRPVMADLLLGNQKVAGAAQRRTRDFLLHQGSIQHLPVENWRAAEFAAYFCPQARLRSLTPAEIELAGMLATTRYGTPAWLENH